MRDEFLNDALFASTTLVARYATSAPEPVGCIPSKKVASTGHETQKGT